MIDDKTIDAQGTSYIVESKGVLSFDFNAMGSMTLSAGVQYLYESYLNNNSDAKYAEIKGHLFEQNTIAPYVEAEYYITDDLILTGGIRYAHSDLFDGEETPRGYLGYHITETITLKGGVAKGLRTPEERQLFD